MLKQNKLIKNNDSKPLGNWMDRGRTDVGSTRDTVSEKEKWGAGKEAALEGKIFYLPQIMLRGYCIIVIT